MKAEEILAKLGSQIDELVEKAKNLETDQREEIDKRINELKENRDKLASDFKNYVKSREPELKELEERGEKFVDEVKEAMENLLNRFR